MGKYFGTDGIRGVVNDALTAELAYRTGRAAALVLAKDKKTKPVITIGKDTRISSDMLEAALTAGLCSSGADVLPLGVMPTPAVAYITVMMQADAGIVISASHNPYEHNGIKFFNKSGFKLSDSLEAEIEELMDRKEPLPVKTHGDIGRVLENDGKWETEYLDHLEAAAEGEIRPMRVVVDCANGAASATASKLFSRFPIDLEIIRDHPNGVNINDKCGSTHLENLSAVVVSGGYDIGIAFDGDADRCLAVDENGREIDGDKIMGVCGRYMKGKGQLKNNAIVATVMSNMGFQKFSDDSGINLMRADVGDRNVLELMQKEKCNLGGEQSGHLIFLDDATTGDGQLAAVKFLSIISKQNKKVSEIVADIPQFPQILENVPISGGNERKNAIMNSLKLKEAIELQEKRLGGKGRVLVRPSGTEAFIRVMTEAEKTEDAVATANILAELIKNI